MTVRIAGAGIAGLTAALAFARKGHEVTVSEAAQELLPIGAGIQMPPNAMRVFRALGLESDLNAHASAPRGIEIIDGLSGRLLVRVPLGMDIERRHGAPYLVVHRGDLQHVLLEAVAREARVCLRLNESHDLREDEECELLVGADGVHSTVREHVRGPSPAVDSGYVAYRTMFDSAELEEWMRDATIRAVTRLFLGPGAHLVHYPVRSGQAVNVVAIARADERGRAFSNWHERIAPLLSEDQDWGTWPILSVDPTGARVGERTALIGDAAAAMLPYAAAGGAMAVEDAYSLAQAWANPRENLEGWAQRRTARVSKVARLARRNRRIYHLDGAMRLARNIVMRAAPSHALMRAMDGIYAWRPLDSAGVSEGSG